MIIGVGPYCGDFNTEILSFRPYVTWLYKNLDYTDFFVSSQYDRQFLYPFIKNYEIVIEPEISNKRLSQKYTHPDISYAQFLKYKKCFKERIQQKIKSDAIHIFSAHYTKLMDPISNWKKIFQPIEIEKTEEDYILYDTEELIHTEYPYKILLTNESYYDIIKKISNAKLVVCKGGFFTILSNLQKRPVISWMTNNLSLYKTNGIYNFNNGRVTLLYTEDLSVVKRTLGNYFKQGKFDAYL